jgi:hypothetical protein
MGPVSCSLSSEGFAFGCLRKIRVLTTEDAVRLTSAVDSFKPEVSLPTASIRVNVLSSSKEKLMTIEDRDLA